MAGGAFAVVALGHCGGGRAAAAAGIVGRLRLLLPRARKRSTTSMSGSWSPHLRASGPSPLGKFYLILYPHCRAVRLLLSGCAQTFAAVCDRAATTMWQRACALA